MYFTSTCTILNTCSSFELFCYTRCLISFCSLTNVLHDCQRPVLSRKGAIYHMVCRYFFYLRVDQELQIII